MDWVLNEKVVMDIKEQCNSINSGGFTQKLRLKRTIPHVGINFSKFIGIIFIFLRPVGKIYALTRTM
jgi:hypothetical protein